jgi:hypothetical protein
MIAPIPANGSTNSRIVIKVRIEAISHQFESTLACQHMRVTLAWSLLLLIITRAYCDSV